MIMKRIPLLLLIISSFFAKAQVTPQFQALQNGIKYYYPGYVNGLTPTGLDTVYSFRYLKTYFLNTSRIDSNITAYKVAQRTSLGDLLARYYVSSAPNELTSYMPTRIFGGQADNYIRPLTATSVANFIGLPNYTPLTNLAGSANYLQMSTGSHTIGNSAVLQGLYKLAYGDSTITSLTFRLPAGNTQQQITATGSPDGLGYIHSNIIFKRDLTATNNYASEIDFYTENKNTPTIADQSSIKMRLNYAGVLSTAGDNAVFSLGRLAFLHSPGATLFGENAGNLSLANGSYDTYVGYENGKNTTTGYNNTGVGFQGLTALTSGFANSSFGIQTLFSATTAQFNFAGSIHSLYSLTTGIANNSIGAGALEYNVTGSGNQALGMYAGRSYLGSNSIFIGHQAGGLDNTSINGKFNVGFVQDSLYMDGNMIGVNGVPGTQPYLNLKAELTTRLANYDRDWSTSYTLRSLIDKGYADAKYLTIANPSYSGFLTGPGGTMQGWTGGGNNNAIYSTYVTPANGNYTLYYNSTTAALNSATDTYVSVGGSGILHAISTGISVTGTGSFSGGIAANIRNITAAATITNSDYTIWVTGGATFSQALPATPNTGQIFIVVNNGAGTITVTATAINGGASNIINSGQTARYQYTGTSGTYVLL
jgi:hypothetical protein